MTNKLIIVEGLPSTGKSTTAKAINEIISCMNYNTELYCEGDYNHPADFDGIAYFTHNEFERLKQDYDDKKELLDGLKNNYHEGVLIPYKKALIENGIVFGDELLNEITQNDVYELPFETHRHLIIKRWKDFVANIRDSDKVIIFECCFIQNPITVTMIRDGESEELTKDYINEIGHIIDELNPILIYLEQDDIEQSFKRVIEERPKEWYDGFIHYYTNQGYGFKNNLKGIDGTLQILKERYERERNIFDSIDINKSKINNSKFDERYLKNCLNSILVNYYK